MKSCHFLFILAVSKCHFHKFQNPINYTLKLLQVLINCFHKSFLHRILNFKNSFYQIHAKLHPYNNYFEIL